MSWDVVLIKTETNSEDIETIDSPVAFDRDEILTVVKTHFPDADCHDEAWLVLDAERYSIEFNLGKAPIQAILLHIRGSEAPEDVISVLCTGLACRAYDTSSGEFIETGKETSFKKWKAYRDTAIESMNQ